MKKIEAIIFDCDGVVVDSTQLQKDAEQHTAPIFAEEHGLDFDPEDFDWDTMQGWARRKIASHIFSVDFESVIAEKFRVAVVDQTVEVATELNAALVPGVADFRNYLAMCGLGPKLGLATASDRRIFTRYCELSPMDFFHPDYIVARGECRDDKPKPGPYIEVMSRMHADPEHTLVIEDSGGGISAGRYAGAMVLGIATTKSAEYLQTQTGAHLVAEDFSDAAKLLQPYLPH